MANAFGRDRAQATRFLRPSMSLAVTNDDLGIGQGLEQAIHAATANGSKQFSSDAVDVDGQ